MAQLPPDGTWLIQQIDGVVRVFHRYTEQEIVRFDPSDANAVAVAQKAIYDAAVLDDEQKCFAHMWSGYFYAHAGGAAEPITVPLPESQPEPNPEAQVRTLSRFPHIYRRVLRIENFEDDDYEPEVEERRPAAPLEEAHVIGSLINGDSGVIGVPNYTGNHTFMVDIDYPVTALPSSTPGHHHLYIDKPMPWDDVVKVLRVLAEVGIVESGYAEASIERGETNLRLPWVRKGEERVLAQADSKRVQETLSAEGEPF